MSRPRLLIFLLAGVLIAVLTAAFWDYTQDDVFITYVYSRNLVEGEGFVFNPGQRVQGTTTPLHTLVMAGVYLVTDDLLHAGNLLSAVFLLGAIGLMLDLTRRHLSIYAAGAFALVMASSPLVYVSFGMETLTYCFILALAFWLWAREQRLWAMVAVAALTWVRADGVMLAGTFGLLALWTRFAAPKQWPWRLAALYVAGIAPWFMFATLYFGSPFPQTLDAKQEILNGIRFINDGLNWWEIFYFETNPLAVIAFPLVAAGVWVVWQRPTLRPLALWAGLYTAGYTVLNVTAFWYYTPLFMVLVLLAAAGGEWFGRGLISLNVPRHYVRAGGAILALLVTGFAVERAFDFAEPPGRINTYKVAGQWINANTRADEQLMVGDLGIVGYYARRHTLDTPGLITPQLAYVNLDPYAVAAYKPDLVFTTQFFSWKRFIDHGWFRSLYQPIAAFSTPGDDFSPMPLYRRRFPIDAPDSVVQGMYLGVSCRHDLHTGDSLPEMTSVRLLDEQGEIIRQQEQQFLFDQYPVRVAEEDEQVIEMAVLSMDVIPGDYSWEGCDDDIHRVTVIPIETADGYHDAGGLQWGDFVALNGVYFPNGDIVWSGGELEFLLHWQALEQTEESFSVFVHLVDESGDIAAQDDGYPRLNTIYSSDWTPDTPIFDIRRIVIPPNTPAGTYHLRIGWYDWRSGERFLTGEDADLYTVSVEITVRWPGGSGLP
ncbi:MAG: hypothetical protein L0154_12665 [Chloroflexi bacterium]|nr:hypothetical protein [Chloroflexota bacterium]